MNGDGVGLSGWGWRWGGIIMFYCVGVAVTVGNVSTRRRALC